MSLLSIIQDSADRLGIARPSAVMGSTDQQVRQLLGLAQQEGRELSRRFPWQVIVKEKTFTSTATETQSGVIPTDFDRFINGTFYNRTFNRRVEGPMNAWQWQSYKSSVTNVIFDAFRQRGGDLLLAPIPTAGSTYAYEYVSKNWCASNSGTGQAAWAADTDEPVLSDELMTDGINWRFLKAKGFDYSEPFRTYEAQVMLAMTKDGGARSVYMAGPTVYRGPRFPRFPDGSWNLT